MQTIKSIETRFKSHKSYQVIIISVVRKLVAVGQRVGFCGQRVGEDISIWLRSVLLYEVCSADVHDS